MNNDLKIIKKKYGEKMMHYCREEFSTILEYEGLLSKLFLDHFHKNHSLYEDIQKEDKLLDLKKYIYSLIDVENNMKIVVDKTPKELLSEAGYELYECKSEEEIQSFKKYYSKDEELCTFKGNRLDYCYVFFAVKKNVDEIKREDFTKPERQDLYGTSVISIQFTKETPYTLSIKNRYNHMVNNPDATFSNNLDNIILGLTKSFENEYRFIQTNKNNGFELKNYVFVNGKYYKYNYEIDNIYYCSDNIVIDNYEIKQYDKERYIVFDYFILDLKEKKLVSKVKDAFIDTIKNIDKIKAIIINEEKEIHIRPIQGEEIIIRLDEENRIISYTNNNVWEIGNDFLCSNKNLKELNLSSLVQCGNDFLSENEKLQELNLLSLRQCGDGFLSINRDLQELNLPNLEQCGCNFLYCNEKLTKLNLLNLRRCGNDFLSINRNLKELNLPSLQQCGDDFLSENENLKELNLLSLRQCGDDFLSENENLKELNLPNLEQCGHNFLFDNENLKELNLLNLRQCGDGFLSINRNLKKLNLPNLEQCGCNFLYCNEKLTKLNFPSLEQCRNFFLAINNNLKELNLLNLKEYDEFINSIILEYLEQRKIEENVKTKTK